MLKYEHVSSSIKQPGTQSYCRIDRVATELIPGSAQVAELVVRSKKETEVIVVYTPLKKM